MNAHDIQQGITISKKEALPVLNISLENEIMASSSHMVLLTNHFLPSYKIEISVPPQ